MTKRKPPHDLYSACMYREDLLRRLKYPRLKSTAALRSKVDKTGKMRPLTYYNALERAIASAAAERRERLKKMEKT